MDVRLAEEAEVDRKMEGRVPPCVDGSGGEAARDVRRAWAWRSAVVKGSGVEKTRRAEVERWGREQGESWEEIGRAGL